MMMIDGFGSGANSDKLFRFATCMLKHLNTCHLILWLLHKLQRTAAAFVVCLDYILCFHFHYLQSRALANSAVLWDCDQCISLPHEWWHVSRSGCVRITLFFFSFFFFVDKIGLWDLATTLLLALFTSHSCSVPQWVWKMRESSVL